MRHVRPLFRSGKRLPVQPVMQISHPVCPVAARMNAVGVRHRNERLDVLEVSFERLRPGCESLQASRAPTVPLPAIAGETEWSHGRADRPIGMQFLHKFSLPKFPDGISNVSHQGITGILHVNPKFCPSKPTARRSIKQCPSPSTREVCRFILRERLAVPKDLLLSSRHPEGHSPEGSRAQYRTAPQCVESKGWPEAILPLCNPLIQTSS